MSNQRNQDFVQTWHEYLWCWFRPTLFLDLLSDKWRYKKCKWSCKQIPKYAAHSENYGT